MPAYLENAECRNAVFHLTDYTHLWYHATRNLHPAYIELAGKE
jgi:hypothetical protein